MSYQICDSIQGLCSYLRGVVSTSAVLTAAGVGDANATAMSAAMTWALRDGLGMVGGLTFSYVTSFLFDAHVKEFRLFADVINDVGLTLDMVAPLVGTDNNREYVLYITTCATVCKIMCGIAAGATKGSITQHFCKRGNMADLNAKEGTQETLVSLLGMILGVVLARYLQTVEDLQSKERAAALSWAIFLVLTVVHVWVNYIGVKVLRLKTLNKERTKDAFSDTVDATAQTVVRELTKSNTGKGKDGTDNSNWAKQAVLSIRQPDEVNESLLSSAIGIVYTGRNRVGASFRDTYRCLAKSDFSMSKVADQIQTQRYLIGVDGKTICCTLAVGATDLDELRAFLHMLVLRSCIDQSKHAEQSTTLIEW